MDDFTPGPSLPRCPKCNRLAPRKGEGCVVCYVAEKAPTLAVVVPLPPAAVPMTSPNEPFTWPALDPVYGRPHPCHIIEERARATAGPPPIELKRQSKWRMHLEDRRVKAQRAYEQERTAESLSWFGVVPGRRA